MVLSIETGPPSDAVTFNAHKFVFSISAPPNPELNLIEETKNFACNVLPPGLLVVHDTSAGGEDDVAELTGRKELDNPFLEVGELDVVARADDTGLVEAGDMLAPKSLEEEAQHTGR
jgi:hypothetical protein